MAPCEILQVVQNIKEGDQTRQKKNGKKQGILDLMWPVTSYSLLCVLKEPVIINHPIKTLLNSQVCFQEIWTLATGVTHSTSTFGEDCQACTCASVLLVLPNGSMTMCTGHKWGCNINEPQSVSMFGERHPHVQELNGIPSILPPLEPAVKNLPL